MTDITEDLGEQDLAEVVFGEEVVVYWHDQRSGEKTHGIIVGYRDLGAESGLFEIDVVKTHDTTAAPSGWTWKETGDHVALKRTQFVVFGPANRDEPVYPKGDPEQGDYQEVLSFVPSDRWMIPFLVAMNNLMTTDQTDTGEPAFDVRLDAKACGKPSHHDGRERGHYHYRILVRPTTQPLMHNEIETVLRIASECELWAFHSNAGIEIRQHDDLD